jgi:hypothetical protein
VKKPREEDNDEEYEVVNMKKIKEMLNNYVKVSSVNG